MPTRPWGGAPERKPVTTATSSASSRPSSSARTATFRERDAVSATCVETETTSARSVICAGRALRSPCALGLVRILRRAVVRQRLPRARDEGFDRVGEVLLADVVVAAIHAEPVRLEQNVRVRVAERRLEAIGRELDQEPERVLEGDRVHEAAILAAAVPDLALVEPLDRLTEGGLRERERDVMHAAGVGGRAGRVAPALLVREDGDQAPVSRIEVEVALRRVVEVRLLEDEGHAEHAFPEVDRRLPVGADARYVGDPPAPQLPHRCSPTEPLSSAAA